MDKKKIIAALILLPAFIWLIGWAPIWLLALIIGLVVPLASYEFCSMISGPVSSPDSVTTALAAILVYLASLMNQPGITLMLIGLIVCLALTKVFLLEKDLSRVGTRAAWITLGSIYTGLLPAFLVMIKRYEADVGGSKLLMMLFALVWINDSAAYFAGNLFGKRKLAPIISPAKTLEGFIGGVAASIILGIFISAFSPTITLADGLMLGIVMGLMAPAGDLAESALKRGAGLKDSGVFLPGHGGVLDRIDSILFGAPIFLLFIFLKISGSIL